MYTCDYSYALNALENKEHLLTEYINEPSQRFTPLYDTSSQPRTPSQYSMQTHVSIPSRKYCHKNELQFANLSDQSQLKIKDELENNSISHECVNCGVLQAPSWYLDKVGNYLCISCSANYYSKSPQPSIELFGKLHNENDFSKAFNKSLESNSFEVDSCQDGRMFTHTYCRPYKSLSCETKTLLPNQLHYTSPSSSNTKKCSRRAGMICSNCHTCQTSLWRRTSDGDAVCNACGLYKKMHGCSRPLSLRKDAIQTRKRKSKKRKNQQSIELSPMTINLAVKRRFGIYPPPCNQPGLRTCGSNFESSLLSLYSQPTHPGTFSDSYPYENMIQRKIHSAMQPVIEKSVDSNNYFYGRRCNISLPNLSYELTPQLTPEEPGLFNWQLQSMRPSSMDDYHHSFIPFARQVLPIQSNIHNSL